MRKSKKKNRKCALLTILAFAIINITMAQDLSFFHLSKKDGLSDNRISGVIMDKNGLLWIGTSEGLNCYDGYKVTRFYKEEYPSLQNNNILRMTCDEKNRLWIHFVDKSITMLDEERQFHSISITENGKPVEVDFLLPYTSRGVLFLSGSRLYGPDKKNPFKIKRIPWREDPALAHNFVRINTWDKDKLICSGNNRLCLFDVTSLEVMYNLPVPDILAAVRVADDEALVTTNNNDKLCRINFKSKKMVQCYGNLKDQFGEEMMIYPRSIYHLIDSKFIFTSAYAGLYLFDADTESLTRYKHDPFDPKSISANNTTYLFSDTSGYFFVTSSSAGLNYFNINHYLVKWEPSFRDGQTGKIFDGYVNCIAQDSAGHIWLGTQNSLIEWNRQNNSKRFQSYGKIKGQNLEGAEEVRVIHFDSKGRMWIGLNRFGVIVMNRKKEIIKYLNNIEKNDVLAGNFINDIKEAPDGNIWIATSQGLNIINPKNFQVIGPDVYPYLEKLSTQPCRFIYFKNETEAWIATNDGAYKISLNQKKWKRYNKENGLKDNDALCITGDETGNIYVGTSAGLYIIANGNVVNFYNRSNGLRSNKCEGLLKDDKGKIWIGNNNSLVCYDPATKSIAAYDEGSGLSDGGLMPIAFFKTTDGEIFWGSDKGVNYFDPDRLRKLKLPLKLIVHSVAYSDSIFWLANSKHVSVPWSKNSISFAFSAIDLYSSKNIVYKYMLEGADDSWNITSDPQQVQYSKLSPGEYLFRLMASKDGQQWIEATNTVSVTIKTPWWRSKFFLAGCLTILMAGAWFLLYSRNKQIRQQQEQIETEKAINYFASSMNEQTTTDDILWDVARNCIGRLNFEDCVIYLKDELRPVLIQKAAWGPKTSDKGNRLKPGETGREQHENKILNPIEIPAGAGIVGSVAVSGKAEIVNDTSKDDRYIIDDRRRLSEITVPIIYNDKVLGIIDSENSNKNFFTQKHLSILTTIASLCANKLVRVNAETDKQKALLELLNYKRKTAEAQLKSLRLQMNPHFLFNSLNSIQQIILAGDERAATLYLSKFSRLLRLVLVHSDRENITLKEELEMLNLYVELESLRFKGSFHYEIICDKAMDPDEIRIPTLLIQPFVENAIWHGLLHKEGSRSLLVKMTEDKAENVICIVEDNGIGRDASRKNNVQNAHLSKGIAVAEERLKTYNNQHLLKSKVLIEDLKDVDGNASGTRVIMTLPLLN